MILGNFLYEHFHPFGGDAIAVVVTVQCAVWDHATKLQAIA